MAIKADDVRSEFETRLKAVEGFVWWAKGLFAGLGAVAFVGLGIAVTHVVTSFPKVASDVAVLNSKAPAIEASYAELKKGHHDLADQHNRLRTRVAVLVDRQAGGVGAVPEAIVYWGKVLSQGKDGLHFLPDDMGEPSWMLTLAPDVRVQKRGRALTVADVKAGATIGVYISGGQVASIEVQ